MKIFLLLLWNTYYLPDTPHHISSHAPNQVGVVQEMLSVGIMSCGAAEPAPSASTVYIPSTSEESRGCFVLLDPFYWHRKVWLVAKNHLKIGLSTQNKPHAWVHSLTENKYVVRTEHQHLCFVDSVDTSLWWKEVSQRALWTGVVTHHLPTIQITSVPISRRSGPQMIWWQMPPAIHKNKAASPASVAAEETLYFISLAQHP